MEARNHFELLFDERQKDRPVSRRAYPLNIPGHAMFFTMFFLILASGGVPKAWAATPVGLVAGCLAVLLGIGKRGSPDDS